jgi:maltose phosphorylase
MITRELQIKSQMLNCNLGKSIDAMYSFFSEEHNVYLQQDGFLDIGSRSRFRQTKDQSKKWSWDRIYVRLTSNKLMFCSATSSKIIFERRTKKIILNFTNRSPFMKVHCVHSIQAALLDKMDMAYTFYLRTSRLDLDDYNKEVEEGCHITSMAELG